MLTKEEIRLMAGNTFYARGVEIYNAGKVRNFEVEEVEDGIWFITARVKGSGRYSYAVELTYDNEMGELTDSFCECPAFYSYDNLCKHCAAVLLHFVDYEQTHPVLFISKKTWEKEQKLPVVSRQPETSPALKGLLMKQFMERTFPMTRQEIYGKVCLEPYMEWWENGAAVEFRIGITKLYVLKDVFKFRKHMMSMAEYSYGKNLTFPHVMGAFTEKSKRFADFILHWTVRNEERYYTYSYYGYSNGISHQKVRSMPLDEKELEEFLNAVGEDGFQANVFGGGEREWHVSQDGPQRHITLTGGEHGITLKVSRCGGIAGEEQCYYPVDGVIYQEKISELAPIRDFLLCMEQEPDGTAFIQKEDAPAFCSQLLPVLEQFYQCEKADFNAADYLQSPASFEIYLDAPQKDFITCKLFAVYGDKKYLIYGKEADKERSARDIFREMEVGQAVSSYFNAYDEEGGMMALSGDEDKLYELLGEGLMRMQELGEVFVSDALKKIRVSPSPKVSMGVSLAGDMLELSMSTEDMPMEQLIEILSRYDRRKKYYRLKNGSFVDMTGGELETLARLKGELGITDRQLRQEQIVLPKYRALYLDDELKGRQTLGAVRDKNFKELVRNMKTVEDNDFEIPASLEEIMREYQKKGFLWLKTLKNNGFGGILADDMGLGKTLQVIAFLLSEFIDAGAHENKRCLIVAPASLVFNWSSEIERFAPVLSVRTVTGTAEERKRVIQESGERDILLTSYDLLRRDIDSYAGIRFYCQVIDEAQYIKNHNTQAARAVKEVEAAFKLALTGTPVENRLSELWSIFDYLMPGFLYAYQRFREEIELPIVQNHDENAMRKLQRMIGPFVLRRLKKDVLTDLPDKLEEAMYARLEGEQQKLYDAHVQRMRMMLDKTSEEEFKNSKIQILAELTKLRQLCCDPSLLFEGYQENSAKMDMCMDLVRNAINGGHKLLLFSQFTSMLDLIRTALEKEGIGYYLLTGSTPKEKRLQMVEQFNRDDTPVFCISLKAGGTGLNLTAADIVIHYDPWWNLAVQNQATDRAHRIGQRNVVNVYKLIVKGTIEDNILKLQEKKKELAEQVLGGEEMGSGSFTKEELMELLR
ncbi:MAG: DEAD/DEAH box helicase family protein [Lachnospiraceae bacterium]|nr:DEAD/DEAH box helicase family protein [Lachnospiraceae bacterium]